MKNALISILFFSVLALSFLFWIIYFNERNITPETMSMVSGLPALNATLNAFCSIFLIAGFTAIKKKKLQWHKYCMITAFAISCLFLIGYIAYHTFHGETKFLAQGFIRPTYFFILITHILTSMVALPLVLYTFFLGITDKFVAHKKIAPYCFFIWLYVSVTGVLVYLLLKNFNI